jgi:hypothetical protein
MNACLKGHLTGSTPLDELVDALDMVMLKHGQRVAGQRYERATQSPPLRTASPAEAAAWSQRTHYAAARVAKELRLTSAYTAEEVTSTSPVAAGAPTAQASGRARRGRAAAARSGPGDGAHAARSPQAADEPAPRQYRVQRPPLAALAGAAASAARPLAAWSQCGTPRVHRTCGVRGGGVRAPEGGRPLRAARLAQANTRPSWATR